MSWKTRRGAWPVRDGKHRDVIASVRLLCTGFSWSTATFLRAPAITRMKSMPRQEQKELLIELFENIGDAAAMVDARTAHSRWWQNLHHGGSMFNGLCRIAGMLLARDHKLTQGEWTTILSAVGKFPFISLGLTHQYFNVMLGRLERDAKAWTEVPRALTTAIGRVARAVEKCSSDAPQQKAARRLRTIAARSKPVGKNVLRSRTTGITKPMPLPPQSLGVEKIDVILDGFVPEYEKVNQYLQHCARETPTWKVVSAMPLEDRVAIVVRAVERLRPYLPLIAKYAKLKTFNVRDDWLKANIWTSWVALITEMMRASLPLQRETLLELVELSRTQGNGWDRDKGFAKAVIAQLESHGALVAAQPDVQAWLRAFRTATDKPSATLLAKIRTLLGESHLPLEAGEAWSDRAIEDIKVMSLRQNNAWTELFGLSVGASSTTPSARWLKAVADPIKLLGSEHIRERLCAWFALVDKPRTQERERRARWEPEWTHRIIDEHQTILKGLCWIAATLPSPEMARALGHLAMSAYRKIPGVGPRAVKLGNAAVYALGEMAGMDSVGQLAMLRVKVKFGTAQKGIDKALNAAAAREGLPREEIEELGVPSYGLTGVGVREEEMGEYTAILKVAGIGDTTLVFRKNEDGDSSKGKDTGKGKRMGFEKDQGKPKLIKSAPETLKKSHGEELKEFKASMKDIASMLPAQKDRIDSLYLENKTWNAGAWRARYLDHPLVGVLARRLIWTIEHSADLPSVDAIWLESLQQMVDRKGRGIEIADDATVRLWHPIGCEVEHVLAWRAFLDEHQITQPFKQAHREVYLLTDAERRTNTYSNRYAAHILRQHQFQALAVGRGWKSKLRLAVDADYDAPSRLLKPWELRAEFWVEAAGEDTNEASAYLYLATDQVRFYRTGALENRAHAGGGGYGRNTPVADNPLNQPLQLDLIPPLVLSEILRDCDLFVGVASVGNNPEWNDGGPEGHYRDYWWSYSFGGLSGTGEMRRQVLERLIPRLKIAKVCTLTEKFRSSSSPARTSASRAARTRGGTCS
jgi:hypothetical protein